MRVKFVGGRQDGRVINVTEPLPLTLQFPESPDRPDMTIVRYVLTRRTRAPHEQCYVEEGAFSRWR